MKFKLFRWPLPMEGGPGSMKFSTIQEMGQLAESEQFIDSRCKIVEYVVALSSDSVGK